LHDVSEMQQIYADESGISPHFREPGVAVSVTSGSNMAGLLECR
jgi:hypothetical protein